MSLDPIIPTNETPQPPGREESASAVRARRRRAARQQLFPTDAEGQAARIASLSRRAYPSLELFVFSLACGAIVGLGFLLDSQAVLLLGILVTPLMTPWVGFLLALFTGKPRLLFETLMALLISAVIVFLGGLLSGFAAQIFEETTRNNLFIHARLWMPALIVFSISAILLIVSFTREETPILPSILIAYSFYLPINASGFGIGSGIDGIFPEGLLVFVVHFSLASILGMITLFALKLRPIRAGMGVSGFALAGFAALLFMLMGGGTSPAPQPAASATPTMLILSPVPTNPPSATAVPTNTPRATSTSTSAPAEKSTATETPKVTPSSAPQNTPTSTATFTSTATSTSTLTATSTAESAQTAATASATSEAAVTATPLPLLGIVQADEGGGANLRQTPNGKYIMTLENGTLVEIQPDSREVNGVLWAHVFVTVQGRRLEGWLLAAVLQYDILPTPTP